MPAVDAERTTVQVQLAALAGIVLPLACFFCDPVVFQGVGFLARYKTIAYLLVLFSLLSYSVSLLRMDRKLPVVRLLAHAGLITGILLSITIGILILPFAVAGLVIFIGIFGFTPWLIATLYFRQLSRSRLSGKSPSGLPIIAIMLVATGLSIAADQHLKSQVHRLATFGYRAGYAFQELRWLHPLADLRELELAACFNSNESAEIYHRLTGNDGMTGCDD